MLSILHSRCLKWKTRAHVGAVMGNLEIPKWPIDSIDCFARDAADRPLKSSSKSTASNEVCLSKQLVSWGAAYGLGPPVRGLCWDMLRWWFGCWFLTWMLVESNFVAGKHIYFVVSEIFCTANDPSDAAWNLIVAPMANKVTLLSFNNPELVRFVA